MKRKHPLYKGFILIREYPGCNKTKGSFEPFTTGNFLNFPEIWQPVLHDDVKRDKTIDKILNDTSLEM